MRTVEQVDGFAGRVGAKRVEIAPCKLSSLAERLNDRGLPDGEVVANLESEIRKLCEVGGRRFRAALLPTQTPASREPRPPLIRNWAGFRPKMRPELTSAEIAMSGSYFDDVLLDPRRYGIENTTDKVRRLRREVVCTERIVGSGETGAKHHSRTSFTRVDDDDRYGFALDGTAREQGHGHDRRTHADRICVADHRCCLFTWRFV